MRSSKMTIFLIAAMGNTITTTTTYYYYPTQQLEVFDIFDERMVVAHRSVECIGNRLMTFPRVVPCTAERKRAAQIR